MATPASKGDSVALEPMAELANLLQGLAVASIAQVCERFSGTTATMSLSATLGPDGKVSTVTMQATFVSPRGLGVASCSGGGLAAAAMGGGAAKAMPTNSAERMRQDPPPRASAPAARARARAARAASPPEERADKKTKKRPRKEGGHRRRSPSSRGSSRARAERHRLAQKAKRVAGAAPSPAARTATIPPATRPDCQGDLAAPSVPAATQELRPSPPHGAPAELTLGGAGATLPADADFGDVNLEEAWAGMECAD